MICKHCKTDNPDGMKFCSSCGKPLVSDSGVSENHGNGLKHFNLIDRILKYLAVIFLIIACFFLYLRSNYIVDGPNLKTECCQGHCVEMDVSVHDKYNLVSAYDIDEFNVVYPCPKLKKNSLMPAPEPLNEANLQKFTMKSVELYQIRATVQVALWGAIAILLFLVRKFIRKRNDKKTNNIQ